MSRVTHSLVGYDRASERVAAEFEVPDTVLSQAKAFARVPADDPDVMMCYRLDAGEARKLAALVDAVIDAERHDYFLEGHASEAGDPDFSAKGDLGVVPGD